MGISTLGESEPCPHCHASFSKYRRNGGYKRHLVSYSDGRISDQIIHVVCVRCFSCGRSHAILPSVLIPHTSYSFRFIIALLYSRITRKFKTIRDLCAHFDISTRTYYRIRHRFLMDSLIFSGIFSSLDRSSDLILTLYEQINSVCVQQSLWMFFKTSGYSFLQPRITFRQGIRIPDSTQDLLRQPVTFSSPGIMIL